MGRLCIPVLVALAVAVAGGDSPARGGSWPSSTPSQPTGPAIYDVEDLFDQSYQEGMDRQAELQLQEARQEQAERAGLEARIAELQAEQAELERQQRCQEEPPLDGGTPWWADIEEG